MAIPPFRVPVMISGPRTVSSSPSQAATDPGNSKFAKALASKQDAATVDAASTPKTPQEEADLKAFETVKASFMQSCCTLAQGPGLDSD